MFVKKFQLKVISNSYILIISIFKFLDLMQCHGPNVGTSLGGGKGAAAAFQLF